MGYLIDGANLGGRLGGAAGARDAAGVVRRLLVWARARRSEVVVVFDGPPRPEVAGTYGPMKVVWSGAASADERIVARVEAEPERWTVVTADRELARRCRELGAEVMPVAELVARSAAPRRRRSTSREAEAGAGKPAPHAEDRDYWRSVFGKVDDP